MENNVTDNDIEYFKKFVNSGNEDLVFVENGSSVAFFLIFPMIGVAFSFMWLDSVALRIAFLAIMVCGTASAIVFYKCFPGNRGYLFLPWLVVAGIGAMCLSVGMVLAYGISNMLISIFVVAHAVIAVLALNSIAKRVSGRQIPKSRKHTRKKEMYYTLGGCICVIAGCTIIESVIENLDNDKKSMVLAACFMSASTIIWIRARRLFQLYYAVKYSIDVVVNARDAQAVRHGLGEEYQCPLLNKAIEGSHCTKINYENEKMLKQENLKAIKKALHMTSDEIRQICKNCKFYPFQEKDNSGGS